MTKLKAQEISISKVYLDSNNPRHDPIEDEPSIIAHLLANEKVGELARSIASLGTSPIERFAVVPYAGRNGVFVALEGNRRLCALKLLHDPDKAPEGKKKFFRDLKKSAVPKNIDAVIFKDRSEARPWLTIRHEGEQNGIGTRGWNARQQERHNRGSNSVGSVNPNRQAGLLLDYAKDRQLITAAEYAAISITTITRFLSNPLVRDVLGLDNGQDLSSRAPDAEIDKAVTRFLKDAYTGSGVTSRTSSADRKKYAERMRKEGVAVATRNVAARQLKANPKPSGNKSTSKGRHSPNPDTRPTIIPVEFVHRLKDKVLKRIFDELRSIDSHTYSFAAAYLLRAFIEKSVTLYCQKHGLKTGGQDGLHIAIGSVADYLVKQGQTEHTIKPLRVMANAKHSTISTDTLGASIHGSIIPTRAELNRRWDTLEHCFGLIAQDLT